jgi:hypothetical protein
MPAKPPVAGCIEVALQFEDSADLLFGSRFFLSYTSGTPSVADLTSLCTAVGNAWNTEFSGNMSSELTLVNVIATDLATTSGNRAELAVTHAGTNADAVPTLGTCTVIDFQIQRRYRGGKPRIYLPIGTTGHLASPSTWLTTFTSGIQTAWGTFMSTILGGTYSSFTLQDNINVSWYEGFTVVTNPVTGRSKNVPKLRTTPVTDNITNHSVRSILGTQRRRLKLKS